VCLFRATAELKSDIFGCGNKQLVFVMDTDFVFFVRYEQFVYRSVYNLENVYFRSINNG
jgi:hypothetical protein